MADPRDWWTTTDVIFSQHFGPTGPTPDALYERVRALVRAGLITRQPGKAGVRLTADNVALLLISLLASDSLSESADATRLFAEAIETDSHKPSTFREALAGMLDSGASLRDVLSVEISRSRRVCKIEFGYEVAFDDDSFSDTKDIVYLAKGALLHGFAQMDVTASLYFIEQVAEDLRVANETGRAPDPTPDED